MRATLINHEQVDIAEKVVAGLDEDAVLTHRVVPLMDGAGNAIVDPRTGRQTTTTQLWSPAYVAEAFVTVIEGLLLTEAVQLVAPIWEGATVMPAYSRLVPGVSGVFSPSRSTIPRPTRGRSIPRSWRRSTTATTTAASCSRGRTTAATARRGPARAERSRPPAGEDEPIQRRADAPERFSDSGVLTSDEIAEACERLAAEYGVRRASGSAIAPACILSAIVPTLLERLPIGPRR